MRFVQYLLSRLKFVSYCQESLNSIYEKLPFDLGQAHSEMLWGIAAAFFFQRLFPISSYFALGLSISCYYCQKIRLAKLSKRPNYHTEDVGRSSLFVLNMMPGVYAAGLMIWDNCTIDRVDPLTWVFCVYGLVIIFYPPYIQLTKWQWFQRLVRRFLKLGECGNTSFSKRSLRAYFITSRSEEAKKLWRFNLGSGLQQLVQYNTRIVEINTNSALVSKFTRGEIKKMAQEKDLVMKDIRKLCVKLGQNLDRFKELKPFEFGKRPTRTPNEPKYDKDGFPKPEIDATSEIEASRTLVLNCMEKSNTLIKDTFKTIIERREYEFVPVPSLTSNQLLDLTVLGQLHDKTGMLGGVSTQNNSGTITPAPKDQEKAKEKERPFDPLPQEFDILYDPVAEGLEIKNKSTYADGAYAHYMEFEKPVVPFTEMNKHFNKSYDRVNPVTADQACIEYFRKRAST